MRPSSKTLILEAAMRVAENDGITSVTLDSVAEAAGLTKGGLLYHFRTRDALMLAIQRHIADCWEEKLLAALGKPVEESTQQERLAAYTKVSVDGASRADLVFVLESVGKPELCEPWNTMIERWSPDMTELDLFVAWLAADGLWLYEVSMGTTFSPELRTALTERISALAAPADG
ncbi:TetR/AcrR family transcriptional regulator [Actinoalloteichus hymeniacidonis]|uniref:Transcriptional regulator, TetR family n=1 Tax=Actinoalloteichus hymeniacidonis TaxID=340345 RepID=A0AAC9HT84_9PSEU|nr:TetR/AcrR family transcriptional regulator [Actinoalloteichus hymeniacidonis]AOS64055.1 transcriptional regulator, TetR family [Actinoalloteichus hymeniacidonis]MBB5907883.1 AcrR family transcriptional regulator [Actinoalloteichus hymeniacidonis]